MISHFCSFAVGVGIIPKRFYVNACCSHGFLQAKHLSTQVQHDIQKQDTSSNLADSKCGY